MYASTIKTALQTNPLTQHAFRNVVPADLIPNKKEQRGIYVVNTQPRHKPGEHWVTLEYHPHYTYYFDPYGLPPTPTILHHLRKTKAKRPFLYSRVRRQGRRRTCGLYCIYHTLTRTTKRYSMNIFNTDLDFNDRLVHALVHQLFPINS